MKDFSELKRNLKKDFSSHRNLKVALLGDSSTQLLVQSIRGMGFEYGLDLEIWEADYDQIDLQIENPSSELYENAPEIAILFRSTEKLMLKFNASDSEGKNDFAQRQIRRIEDNVHKLQQGGVRKVILFNFAEIDDGVYGSFANQCTSSFLYQIRKLNIALMDLAGSIPDVSICDLSSVQNRLGRDMMIHPSLYISSDVLFSYEALPAVSHKCVQLASAMLGQIKKCLILDLDNTLWGGVIGDDGMEKIQIGSLGIGKAFTEFQQWAKKLKERGVILAICSKNTEELAMEPFLHHPDMVLRMSDIAVFKANWNSKVDNIREIQEILNIGFDSMVFLDDNPFERNLIRDHIPQICVPELPKDPAEYLSFLYGLDLFETVTTSEEDTNRTEMYQAEAKRLAKKADFFDEREFLQSLEMRSSVEGFCDFNTPRIAQLSQRSNQFNLRTVRYTESGVKEIISSDYKFGFAFSLEDKFGDHGLISAVILEATSKRKLFIDTWIMSCRVLKRGMEQFVLNELCSFAEENGYTALQGEYLPTAKNSIVEDLYPVLEFDKKGDAWLLSVEDFEPRESFIKKV